MNLNKRKTLLLAFVLIVMGLVLLFQNLNQSAIDDTLSKKKSEDYYKLEYALNNGCLPTWLVDTKYSTYEGKDVIIGYGKDRKDKYVFYSDLTAKNIDTGKKAVWNCDGIENLDISGNPLPTDEEMHAGAIYDNGGNIVADEYERDENNRILKEERDEIERQNIQRQTDNSYNDVSQCTLYDNSGFTSSSHILGNFSSETVYDASGFTSSSHILAYCKSGTIYDNSGFTSSSHIIGYYKDGTIYDNSGFTSYSHIRGYYNDGTLYDNSGFTSYSHILGYYKGGGASCAAALAYLLLF